jgi:hypothetical protein
MTPERLTKIRAIAADPRGDPRTRAVAQKILDRYKLRPRNPPNPRLQTTEDYDRYVQRQGARRVDRGTWKKTV